MKIPVRPGSEAQNIIDAGSSIKKINGFWQCLLADDFDGDGDIDFMAGNLGLNTKFMKQDEESMLVLYHGDFDGDGKNDPIPAYKNKEGNFSRLQPGMSLLHNSHL